MVMQLSRELLKGSITLLVLKLLLKRPMYGYEIIQEAHHRSKKTFELNEGTLYPSLHQLERGGFLDSKWVVADSGRKRKYYSLTAKGRERAQAEEKGWEAFTGIINMILKRQTS